MNNAKNKISYISHEKDVRKDVLNLCLKARKLEFSGLFEEAAKVFSPFWEGVGTMPNVEKLNIDESLKAEVLLRCGVLTGWIGKTNLISGSQEKSQELIRQSQLIFDKLELFIKSAEAQVEIAYCYWREGLYDEAVALLSSTIKQLDENDKAQKEIKLLGILRLGMVEYEAKRYQDSFLLLKNSENLFLEGKHDSFKGKYHNTLARTLHEIALIKENDQNLIDASLIEYTKASYWFEQVGFKFFCATTENNIGWIYHTVKKFDQALEHYEYAKKMAVRVKDKPLIARIDDNIAFTYLAKGQPEPAEKFSRQSFETFEKASRYGHMAEALTTNATALARLGRFSLALQQFEKAENIAVQRNVPYIAGIALITLMEELSSQISPEKMLEYYLRADSYLQATKEHDKLQRLLKSARFLLENKNLTKPSAENVDKSLSQTSGEMMSLESVLQEIQEQYQKSLNFTSEAFLILEKFYLTNNQEKLRSIIVKTLETCKNNETISADAVEIVALRGTHNVSFCNPWKDFSLRDLTHGIEHRLIEIALKEAQGKITIASDLLGFKHYEMLHSIIKSRHPELLDRRIPPVKRKRSIIRKTKNG